METNMSEYSNLSEKEIQNVIDNAEKALISRQSQKRKEVRSKIKELADSIGLVATLTSAKAKRKSSGIKIPPKYRDPANYSNTWTGRGASPRWLRDLVNQGNDRSKYLIT